MLKIGDKVKAVLIPRHSIIAIVDELNFKTQTVTLKRLSDGRYFVCHFDKIVSVL